ncbi:MAG: 5-(carboxyamino)imidazole ribonucleotide mutase [Spirochaetaceae bacterium]|nr:MAG: 5-(carboxyamino)imidazole ribonucleotide mutase [Spirochaetaceae bacterium]
MGSTSDLTVMSDACRVLEELGIPYDVSVVSAHRTPRRMYEFATAARSRGVKVIIAGAGGAAHLPGMVAAITDLPVIGVPVRGSSLDGLDSLLSIVQMPRGVPVATVAINNARNAGLLAARILSLADSAVTKALEVYRQTAEQQVEAAAADLERDGWSGANRSAPDGKAVR